jgi:hypothetical protein
MQYEGKYLYDIFNSSQDNAIWLEFVGKSKELLIWSNDTIVHEGTFLPVFTKDDQQEFTHLGFKSLFKLFSIIRTLGSLPFPIDINLSELASLSVSHGNKHKIDEFPPFHNIRYNKATMSDDVLIDLEDMYCEKGINFSILLKYPYNRYIPEHFRNLGLKVMELDLDRRFYYNEIHDDHIILLPRELNGNDESIVDPIDCFTVIDTGHDIELYDLMKEFKRTWLKYDFNRFTTPFPKYWFMFINQELTPEEWKQMFEMDYGLIKEKSLMKEMQAIIQVLHHLNWSRFLTPYLNNSIVMLPSIGGARYIGQEKAIISFKNTLLKIDPTCKFICPEDIDDYHQKDILVLDPYNIINLVNVLQKVKAAKIRVIIPDFLHFCYQPWISYHILEYQSNVLLNTARRLFDPGFERNKDHIHGLRASTISHIRSETSNYFGRFQNIEEQENELPSIENMIDDILLSSEEVLQFYAEEDIPVVRSRIEVTTKEQRTYTFQGTDKIYVLRQGLVLLNPLSLTVGDLFIPEQDLMKLINNERFVNRLSDCPGTVKDYQSRLNDIRDVFRKLKNRGISYLGESYFKKSYLIDRDSLNDESFKIPRKMGDWKIICDMLMIDSVDMAKASIAYYGRKKINRLRNIYKQVISVFCERDYWGMPHNPEVLEEITNLLEQYEDIVNEDGAGDLEGFARSMISTIMNELELYQVDKIIIFEHE